MINVIAIDDEPLALQQIATYIKRTPFFNLAAECQSALEARQLMDTTQIDAIFCDINMPDLSGIDFVKQLPIKPLVVFTTAYSDYALEGYKVDAVDYLLKPIGFLDFQCASLKIRERYELNASRMGETTPSTTTKATSNDSIFVKTDYKTLRITIASIRYIEGMSEYLKIYLTDEPKPIITLLSMKKMEDFLPSYFMRIHRSYIVNLNMITEINKNRIVMDANTYLPIGDNYREKFNQYLATRFLSK